MTHTLALTELKSGDAERAAAVKDVVRTLIEDREFPETIDQFRLLYPYAVLHELIPDAWACMYKHHRKSMANGHHPWSFRHALLAGAPDIAWEVIWADYGRTDDFKALVTQGGYSGQPDITVPDVIARRQVNRIAKSGRRDMMAEFLYNPLVSPDTAWKLAGQVCKACDSDEIKAALGNSITPPAGRYNVVDAQHFFNQVIAFVDTPPDDEHLLRFWRTPMEAWVLLVVAAGVIEPSERNAAALAGTLALLVEDIRHDGDGGMNWVVENELSKVAELVANVFLSRAAVPAASVEVLMSVAGTKPEHHDDIGKELGVAVANAMHEQLPVETLEELVDAVRSDPIFWEVYARTADGAKELGQKLLDLPGAADADDEHLGSPVREALAENPHTTDDVIARLLSFHYHDHEVDAALIERASSEAIDAFIADEPSAFVSRYTVNGVHKKDWFFRWETQDRLRDMLNAFREIPHGVGTELMINAAVECHLELAECAFELISPNGDRKLVPAFDGREQPVRQALQMKVENLSAEHRTILFGLLPTWEGSWADLFSALEIM